MSSILQSYWRWKVLREAKNGFKYEAVFGFEIAGAEAWNWLRSAILNLNRSMSKAKCCATWMMLALPGKPFCGCYVLFVSSCFWKSNFDLLSWGLVEKFVVGLQVVQRGCSCDGCGKISVAFDVRVILFVCDVVDKLQNNLRCRSKQLTIAWLLFLQKAPARFLPNRLCRVSCHVFWLCWWDEQGLCRLVI